MQPARDGHEVQLLDRYRLIRSPFDIYAVLFKIGVVLLSLAFVAFPTLATIIPGATVERVTLLRCTVVALLLVDTA